MATRRNTPDASTKEGDKQELRNQNMPDPTSRTIEQMQREISHLKELLLQKSEAMREGIDIAHENLVRFPTEIQKSISALKELQETKIYYESKIAAKEFDFIQKEFNWIEKVRLEQKADSKEALNAALNASKEAVSEQNKSNIANNTKSEDAFTKLIDQMAILITTGNKGLEDKINDVRDRQTRMEGTGTGAKNLWGIIIAVIMTTIAIASFLAN